MARQANYDEMISSIKAKIEKKKEQIKELKSQVLALEKQKADNAFKELADYIRASDMTAEEVLALIKD